ncbi:MULTISPECIES: porin [unclassified Methylophaga]|jgi:hypothetical protein|uniref:porin n=2 Tax=Methylophaga TaxID=40222 RepID=UPI000C8B4291|nr:MULTISPECIES: porin [unclassified Methylophaga]MAK67941.1 porin [Methylophaga sp.]MAY16716.1 porin [Methylophaga sp.]MBN46856.1 porin [Methylophaga sp.]HAO23939.1 porin [Methylophaga sp.]|tara:strand:+ start:170445 stop:171620 length:1176 start_codon:yes stop_codon:yes gene_type:complete
MKKTTLATLVGAAAFAAAGAANATIVVGGENGYEFSVDGNINQFFVQSDADVAGGGSNDNSRVRNGLLPTFFGFNVKAPEINGLTVGARVSISPSTNGGSYFNEGQNGSAMEQREAFATVDGAFGQVMLGKGLGLYGSHNILLDQTLYGVGAVVAGNSDNGQTTLGRIGYGYDYADWRSQMRWTSVDMAGFKVALAVMDADEVGTLAGGSAEKDPRYEADLSYATNFDGGMFKAWLSGMTQKIDGAGGDIKSNAWTLGANLGLGGFDFVAAYYDNKGVGDLGGLAFGSATDANGKERDGDGYYVQAGYTFAGVTAVKASYGESTLDLTSAEKAGTIATYDIDKRSMWTVGVYHDVTSNLKLVAEYSQMEDEFHSGGELDTDVLAIGGFISW